MAERGQLIIQNHFIQNFIDSSGAQEFLFRRIKELLPPPISLVDAVAETLHISSDNAYRRIRDKTPIILE
ncbi:MAG: hypothetical protein JST10_04245 [Bacteroidetes bacterium]|nr:hypothetical protein [Bacteroidota bacterium]MBS1631768.1 hypothetical protein [Bacteroidota bacterium]